MDHDIHPERPRPVEAKPPRSRPTWVEPALCVGAPVLIANILFSMLLGLPVLETIWFGIFASVLTLWSLRLRTQNPEPRTQESEARNSIVVALILSLICFGLAWKFAICFVSFGIAALVFALSSLERGAGAVRPRLGPYAILLFAFPWTDPTVSLIGFPWRNFVAASAAAAAKPLVGAVSVQGTTIGAESMKLALAWDVGGLWQVQFFLLCALGLVIGSDWKPVRYAIWIGLTLLSALAAYIGFVASLFVASVLVAGGVTQAWGNALELGWWAAAFGVVLWFAGRLRSKRRHEAARKAAERSEAMFPEDLVSKS